MKVNAYKNIDVEFEADISIEDVLHELSDILSSEDWQSRKLEAIDQLTRIFEATSPDILQPLPDLQRRRAVGLIRSRLAKWLEFLAKNSGGDA